MKGQDGQGSGDERVDQRRRSRIAQSRWKGWQRFAFRQEPEGTDLGVSAV